MSNGRDSFISVCVLLDCDFGGVFIKVVYGIKTAPSLSRQRRVQHFLMASRSSEMMSPVKILTSCDEKSFSAEWLLPFSFCSIFKASIWSYLLPTKSWTIIPPTFFISTFHSILLVPRRVIVMEVLFHDKESSNVCSSLELHKRS